MSKDSVYRTVEKDGIQFQVFRGLSGILEIYHSDDTDFKAFSVLVQHVKDNRDNDRLSIELDEYWVTLEA